MLPPVAPFLATLGVAAIVTRPAPHTTPIPTTGIWLEDRGDPQPFGTDFHLRAPRRVLAIPRADVPELPTGTTIAAPEVKGGPVKTWQRDHLAQPVDPQFWEVIVKETQQL